MITLNSFNNDLEAKTWDEFVASHPKGTPFHLSNWIRTLYQTYPFKPLAYKFINNRNRITGIFPYFMVRALSNRIRFISLPFSDYGGPLCQDENVETGLLKQIINGIQRRGKNLEIRGHLLKDSGLICHNYYKRHILFLSNNPEEVKKSIDKKTIQYSIRKAEKAGVLIKEENTLWCMQEFYRLHLLTRKKHGIPSPPFKFFKNLFDNLVSKKIAFILLALYDSKVIAAGIFFKFKEIVYYKYNASDPQYLSHQTPNHLLTWYAIERACLDGYQYFDFGRTSPDNEGLMRYKEMWGAKPIDLPYYYYPQIIGAASKEESDQPYKIITNIWRSLPCRFVEKVGPLIYRYFV